MRVTINPTLDMVSMTWLPRPSYEYRGPILSFKDDPTAQSLENSQAGFAQQLVNIFNQQYGKQSQIFDYLTGQMKAMAASPTGYNADALAAMRTSATDVNSQETQNAKQAFANDVSARSGGSKLAGVAGATASGEATIGAAGAAQEANSQNAITLADQNLRQQNYWRAIAGLTGQQAAADPLGYSSGATSGANSVANLSQAVTSAAGPSPLQMAGGLVGGAADAFLGGKAFGPGGLFGQPLSTNTQTA